MTPPWRPASLTGYGVCSCAPLPRSLLLRVLCCWPARFHAAALGLATGIGLGHTLEMPAGRQRRTTRVWYVPPPPSFTRRAGDWCAAPQDVGDGRGQVVLLHGSTSSSATSWQVGPTPAGRDWSVTALDLPSHGDSASAGRPLMPDVAAVASAAAVELLVGASFDAVAAAWLCAVQPRFARRVASARSSCSN